MVLTGEVNENRSAELELQERELAAECAELHAEAVILEAMRRAIDDGTMPEEEA